MSDFQARLVRQARVCAGVSMATHVLTVDRDSITFDDDVYKVLLAIEHRGVRDVFRYRPIKLRRAPERIGVDPEELPPNVLAEPVINDWPKMREVLRENGEFIVPTTMAQRDAIFALCISQDLSAPRIFIQALRHYQDTVRRKALGQKLAWVDQDNNLIPIEVYGCGGEE